MPSKEYYEEHKERLKLQRREYYANHKEQENKYSQQYKIDHAEELKEYDRLNYQKNKESEKKRSREYRAKHRDRYLELNRKWHLENKDKERAYEEKTKEKRVIQKKIWKEKNPDKMKIYSINNNAKRRDLTGGNVYVGVKIIRSLWDKQEGKCFYCLKELDKYHVDHYVPLARGGKHEEENLRLACPLCNHKKHAKMPEDFIKEMVA
jgi:5-methylcytosine-specific restriction endonuclease McrA